MKPVTIVSGTAVPLERSDVDTDQIIPSEWLKRVERTGFGAGLFSEWRDDRDFVLSVPDYQGANILLAGPNFGTGSSREHAVWALTDYGFEAVISPRFADIFRNNSLKSGLLTVVLPQETVDQLMAAVKADPSAVIVIDVKALTVECPSIGLTANFPLDAFAQKRLLEGLDDIGLTERFLEEISEFERKRPSWMPTTEVTAGG